MTGRAEARADAQTGAGVSSPGHPAAGTATRPAATSAAKLSSVRPRSAATGGAAARRIAPGRSLGAGDADRAEAEA